MIKYLFIIHLSVASLFSLDLNSLLKSVQEESNKQIQDEKQRLEEFISNKNIQEKLLKQAKEKLKEEEKRSEDLKNKISNNEEILSQKETSLKDKSANLGEMFGSVRQISSDFYENIQNSFLLGNDLQKEELFSNLAQSKKLPNSQKLEQLWHNILDAIIKSGDITQEKRTIILNTGEKKDELITRVGSFAAFFDNTYLTYSKDSQKLIQLAYQPNKNSLEEIFDTKNQGELKNIIIDPTRGTLFSMLENEISLLDRIKQGGIVGYIILALGFLGLIFSLFKILSLNIKHLKIKAQIKQLAKPTLSNPLGKIADIFYKNKEEDMETIEIKISEQVMKEVSKIRKGQSFIKLLAAITPLLGLLGTVTGMIATFQAITLFGTGDPKLMAGGISTALITTVLGLVAAIPLLFTYTYISSKAQELVSILEEQSIGLLAKNLK